jgi:hypothetical protein
MKKIITAFVLSVFVGTGLAWSHEGHADAEHGTGGKEVAIKGELVDMACYMAHEGKGKKHAECAKMCVLKNGTPLGLVTPDGKTYLLVEDHASPKARKPFAQAKELVSETVTIKGDAYERGGLQAIVVESVTKE